MPCTLTVSCKPSSAQVLLTLYATVAERYAADDAGGEEEEAGTAEDGAAHPAAAAPGPSTEELEAATAFSASLAALAAQEEAAGQSGGTISQLAALAAQHAAVLQAMHETAQLAASVRVAAELQQRLADFDAAYAAGSYSEAAWIAVELQKGVAAVPGEGGLDGGGASYDETGCFVGRWMVGMHWAGSSCLSMISLRQPELGCWACSELDDRSASIAVYFLAAVGMARRGA